MSDEPASAIDTAAYLWNSANEQLFLFFNINSFKTDSLWYQHFMVAGSWLGQSANLGLYAAVLACYLLWRMHEFGTRPAAEYVHDLTVLCVGCTLAVLLTSVLKDLFHVPRPYVQWSTVINPGITMPASESFRSFPSGHATFAAAVVTAVWPLANFRARIGLFCLAVWVGWSRMALGVHFPADVAAGYIVGFGTVKGTRMALLRLVPLKLRRRR